MLVTEEMLESVLTSIEDYAGIPLLEYLKVPMHRAKKESLLKSPSYKELCRLSVKDTWINLKYVEGIDFQLELFKEFFPSDANLLRALPSSVVEDLYREGYFHTLGDLPVGFNLSLIPERSRDFDLCRKALKADCLNYEYLPEEFQDLFTHKEGYLAVLKKNPDAVEDIPKDAWEYKEFCIEAMALSWSTVEPYIPKEHYDDWDFCVAIVSHFGGCLFCVPEERRSYELCQIALKQSGTAYPDIPRAWRDKDMTLLALQDLYFETEAYDKDIPDGLWDDPDFCLKAVALDGYCLKFMPESLKTYDVCLNAVQSRFISLQWVPSEIIDEALVLKAIEASNGYNMSALSYVPQHLFTHKVCETAMSTGTWAYAHIPDRMKTAKFTNQALEFCSSMIKYIPKKHFTRELMLAQASRYPYCFDSLPDEYQNAEFALECLRLNGNYLERIPYSLRTYEMCLAAVSCGKDVIRYVPPKHHTEELLAAAVQYSRNAIEWVRHQEKLTPKVLRAFCGVL